MEKIQDNTSDSFVTLREEAKALREQGLSYRKIGKILNTGHGNAWWLVNGPRPYTRRDPGPSGNFLSLQRESPEQRAFRRHPINYHKPGGW